MRTEGQYFPAGSARCIPASLSLEDGALHLRGDGLEIEAPPEAVRASSRLGRLRRRIEFPDGGCFETEDNDAIDAMLRPRDRFLHRLEQSWRMILASLALAAVAAATFAFYGVPWTAGWLARHTPQSVARLTTQQTMYALEGRILKPSRLVPGLQSATQDMFRDIARQAPRGEKGYRLLLRDAPLVGPNAFALPDGTIVITDQLVRLSKNHEEVTGVIIHEMSHVDHAHGLQSVYQAALVPAAIAFITGDVSQAAQFAAVLPGILLQSAYSRAFEQQADADAAELMRRRGEDPAQLGAFLERIEARLCGKGACGPSWLGSHPDSSERAARLRGR